MDSTQESDVGSSQETTSPPSQLPETRETVGPLVARRRSAAVSQLRKPRETTSSIWPLAIAALLQSA